MDWFQVVSLALIQGLTEFLPISSSAHLILPSQILGWQDQGLAFDVGVHVGTLIAVMLYFRRDIISLVHAWFHSISGNQSPEGNLAWYVIFATIPAVVAGLLAGDLVDEYGRSVLVIAAATLIFGALLGWADIKGTRKLDLTQLGLSQAMVIGFAQAIALIPGTSRSGITMTAALMMGYSREVAARFSFLLSVPIILGAGLFKAKDLLEAGDMQAWGLIMAGAAIAAVSAFSCIHIFLKLLERVGMMPFVIYRLVLGVVLLVIYFGFM